MGAGSGQEANANCCWTGVKMMKWGVAVADCAQTHLLSLDARYYTYRGEFLHGVRDWVPAVERLLRPHDWLDHTFGHYPTTGWTRSINQVYRSRHPSSPHIPSFTPVIDPASEPQDFTQVLLHKQCTVHRPLKSGSNTVS